jgi:hypothetical protein
VSSWAVAQRLKAKLRCGLVDSFTPFNYRVVGLFDAPAVLARVEIQIPFNFDVVIRKPPRAWCRESWMRSEPDWHNDATGGMCWVLEDEWRDILAAPERLDGDLVSAATLWLLNNVGSLITRHHYANLARLTAWPKEWDAWPHFDKGAEKYERTRFQSAENSR